MNKINFFILSILFISLGFLPISAKAQSEAEESVGKISTASDEDMQRAVDELMQGSMEEFERIQQRMKEWLRDSLDEDVWEGRKNKGRSGHGFMPPTDFEDRGKEYVVMLDLPGMKKKDIDVEVLEGKLVISGERVRDVQVKRDYQKGSFYRYGRQFGKFKKTVRLPEDAKVSEINAKYHNGVLEVRIGKQESQKPKPAKKISIQ